MSPFLLLLLGLSPDPCAAALKAAPAYTVCVTAGPGVALSRSQAEADELADIAKDAQARFARYFPENPGPYALFFSEDAPPVTALQSAGFVSVLPWASAERIAGLAIESALQRSAEQKGVPVPADVAKAARDKLPTLAAKMRADERDVIAHELGHQWYEAIYWRGRTSRAGGYGTEAPDWIEETAAILMEGPAMSDKRRASFRRAWTAAGREGRARPEAIGDLGHFLRRQHPTAGRLPAADRSGVVSVREGTSGAFYDQGRVFADYLLARTGDPLVFHAITRFLANGGSTEGWFADQRRYPTLPRSVAALERDWAAWVDAQHAKEP